MVKQIEKQKLFHVTVAKPYKQAFAPDQKVTIGEAFNPFFSFYEGSREYPITMPDGQQQNVKAVAFLRQVRDGLINSPEFAKIATEVAIHYVMLCRELIMEEIRCNEFGGNPPSRQRCLYVCETVDEARYWNKRIGESGTVCELTCSGTVHRADASLLLGDSEPLSVTKDRARQYWRGEAAGNPEWETLFVGKATISGFGL
ncbi:MULTISPECIES: DUF2441 domain-containing protein [Rhodopseudomonas]|uniref:DUF2441 domain-containing protein n=1 Tax=Rhodopseudomonas palustris TaxID=1076 RepID=A0A0D7F0A4_RHOPL|nr:MULTISPECIES: DUF2441 domain-containing protein [Rhodopseudomonas]KIZ46210.1 hypothetical protein OO17_06945 [Rhodopseudomonas palustris]MDF3812731.1 DUF2441 domain-containing protein [Rhodopseudomonas sp. BAL398]WOK15792.1 DUF2441 domain-containing protein [Rhodopseudomonas sp. BAL398]